MSTAKDGPESLATASVLSTASANPTRASRRSPRCRACVLAGLGYALVTALAFPPFELSLLAIAAPLPLVWLACRSTVRPWRNGLLAGLGALPFWLYAHGFLADVTLPGFPLLALYLSGYNALTVALIAVTLKTLRIRAAALGTLSGPADWAASATIVIPIIWTAVEFLRGEVVLTGYAWYMAAHPLIEFPILAAPASLLGTYFVTFLVLALAGAMADTAGWTGRVRRHGGLAAALVLTLWLSTGLIGRWHTQSQSMPDGPAYSTTVRASVVSQPGAPREVRVALVQTAVPQDNRLSWTIPQRIADFARFADLTREAASSRPTPDVIVWPETMFPGTTFSPPDAEIERRSGIGVPVSPDDLKVLARLGYSPSMTSESGDTLLPISFFADRLVELQSEVRVPMLIGAAGSQGLRFEGVQPRWDARFNSVFVVADGEVAPGRYDKIELTPFGEVIPYVWRWPQLQQWVVGLGAAGMAFNLSSGRAAVTLDVPIAARDGAPSAPVFGPPAPTAAPPPLPRLTVATPICFEVTRAEHCRALVYAGGVRRAELLVNQSNDGWFGAVPGPGRQTHLLIARWRCVELGVPMVRAVNTGISAAIDQHGRIIAQGVRALDPNAVRLWPAPEGDGVLTVSLRPAPLGEPGTLYGRIGETFGWIMLAFGFLLPIAAVAGQRLGLRPLSTATAVPTDLDGSTSTGVK